jgi:hypothetical protein
MAIYNLNHLVFESEFHNLHTTYNQADTQRFVQDLFAGWCNKLFNVLLVGRDEALSKSQI